MTISVDKLLKLLRENQPVDIRSAAMLVATQLELRDKSIVAAVEAGLDDQSAEIRLRSIQAVGILGVTAALPGLLERIKTGGPESEAAAHAAAALGAKGVKALHGLMPKVSPGVRRYIAAALAGGSAEIEGVALLHDSDPHVIEATARSLLEQLPNLTPKHRLALRDELIKLLTNKKSLAKQSTVMAAIRVLSAIDDSKAAPAFWDRLSISQSGEVRILALQALTRWSASPNKEQLQKLFSCATDSDYRVAGPAVAALRGVPITDKSINEWLPLFSAPDVSVRRLAIERLGDRNVAAVAQGLLKQVDHPDRELRETALLRLTKSTSGQQALFDALLKAPSPESTWNLARGQSSVADQLKPAQRKQLFALAAKYVDADDRRADGLLFLLKSSNSDELAELILEKSEAFRKKKRFDDAIRYLRLLTRDPSTGFAVRFELAGCQLKTSAKELSPDARRSDPCLDAFASLWQGYEAELTKEVEKAKWLDPEDLFYLGFHFAEQEARKKPFAAHLLGLVVKRSPKSKTGQAAKAKIRREALDTV